MVTHVPEMLSKPLAITVRVGDRLELPCRAKVENVCRNHGRVDQGDLQLILKTTLAS